MYIIRKISYLVLLFCSVTVIAKPNGIGIVSDSLKEVLHIYSDRDIYLTNNSIQFFIDYTQKPFIESEQWSNIVYIELVTYNGESIVKQKLRMNNKGVKGIIKIPGHLLTGYYYLKVYTRWMRNYGQLSYGYLPVKIINFNSNKFVLPPSDSYKPMFSIDSVIIAGSDKLALSIENDSVEKRSTINAYIQPADNKIKSIVLSVIPYSLFSGYSLKINPIANPKEFKLDYLPETRGVTLSGILIDKQKSIPIANHVVNISIFDSINHSLTSLTDSAGKFYFDLKNRYGVQEVLVTTPEAGSPISIFVDNDYCNQRVLLPFIPVNISTDEHESYKQLFDRGVIENQYVIIDSQKIEKEDYININYQKPDFKIAFSDYIELPVLSDYFYELIPNVGVRRINNTSVLQVFGEHSELSIYSPMVLLDNVIISDIDKLLQVSPKSIQRIEVLEKPYIHENQIFGGVINIFSNKGDMANIELPSSGLFFNYRMLSVNRCINYEQKLSKNIPLIGNTVFWDLLLDIDSSKNKKVSFKVGDLPGNYLIVVTKIFTDKSVITDTASFIVRSYN